MICISDGTRHGLPAICAATLLVVSAPALSHVTLEVNTASVGSTYKAVLRVPHGCGSEASHTIRVQIPEGFYNVKPMPKPGWKLETVSGEYDKPYDNHGTMLEKGVQEIVWSEGSLPNEWYDEFVFRGSFAADLESGATFYFPTVQECANGEEAWIDTSGEEEVEFPAPALTLQPEETSH